MPTVSLTDAFVKAVEAKTRTSYHDEKLPGLMLRVTPNGIKTFAIWYRDENQRAHLVTLGRYPTMTLAVARETARPLLVKAKLGVLHSLLSEATAASRTSFGDLAARYVEEYAKVQKRSWQYDADVVKGPLLALSGKSLAEINRQVCKQWFQDLTPQGPVWANRSLAVLRRIFNWAIEEGITDKNPAARITPNPEKSRHRILTTAEIVAVWKALDKEDSTTGEAIRMMLITGQRKNEVLSMQFNDVEIKHPDPCWWTINDTKNTLPHRVPLLDLAMRVIGNQAKRTIHGGYVFEAERKSTQPYVTNPMKALRRVQILSGTKEWTIHDLRRTAASQMASLGVNTRVLGAVLNHQESGVTAVYDRHTYDAEKVEALTKWNDHLKKITS